MGELKVTDRYLTPPHIMERARLIWPEGVGLDPFHEEGSYVHARSVIDVRSGGDAYFDAWPTSTCSRTAFVNGPYSSTNPAKTAELCAKRRRQGWEIMNLCPGPSGGIYWRDWILPWSSAVALLGRLAFPAGVDIVNDDGVVLCEKGEAKGGNRTEIALVYQGDDPQRFRRVFSQIAPVLLT